MNSTKKNIVNNSVKCAPWIASQTYKPFTVDSRSVISNEKTHEFLVLESYSSDIWKLITDECCASELKDYAVLNNVEDELNGFLKQLHSASLILFENDSYNSAAEAVPRPKKMQGAKNINAELEMMQWVENQGFLWHVFWEMTYRCNEKCLHCFNPGAAHGENEKSDRNRKELTTEEAYKLIDEMVDIGVFRLTLSGGEVSLRKDFFDILKYARSKRLCVDIFTNGLLLKGKKLDELISRWPHKVSISLYSADADLHDNITKVPGSHERSVSVLKYLNSKGVKTAVKSIQMKHSIAGYGATQDLSVSIGAGFQLDMAMTPGVDGDAAPLDLAVDNLGELVVLAATPESPTYIGKVTLPEENQTFSAEDSVCGAGRTILNIDPTGMISPCNTLPIDLGKVQTNGIKSIWLASFSNNNNVLNSTGNYIKFNASHKKDELTEWKSITMGDFKECGTYDRCKWCQMCPGLSLLEKGDMLASSDVNCRLAYSRLLARKHIDDGLSRGDICKKYNVSEEFGYIKSYHEIPDTKIPKFQRIQFDPGSRAYESLQRVRND